MSTAPSTKAVSALDFKSAALYAVRLVLHSSDLAALQADLTRRMQEAGSFFENEPIVIDASEVNAPLDWAGLLAAIRQHQLHPIGVVAQGDNLSLAQAQGLVLVDLSSAPTRPASTPAPESDMPTVSATAAPPPAQPSPPAVAPAAMVVTRQLRSGQRLYARDTDLIVIGVVGQGAEVIADGNIHVYGPLRGKAMAGARGDTSARIFSTEFNPELVAVAGVYRVLDDQLDTELHRQACVVQLEGESLRIVPLSDKT